MIKIDDNNILAYSSKIFERSLGNTPSTEHCFVLDDISISLLPIDSSVYDILLKRATIFVKHNEFFRFFVHSINELLIRVIVY